MSSVKTTSYRPRRGHDPDEWLANHNLIGELLPFESHVIDPIRALSIIRKEFDSLEPTAQTIRLENIDEYFETPRNGSLSQWLDPLFEILGSWRHPEQVDHRERAKYVNPSYTHLGVRGTLVIENSEERIATTHRLAEMGVPTKATLKNRYGMSEKELEEFFAEHSIEWEMERAHGRVRLAKTWRTLRSWGYTHEEIGMAFGKDAAEVASFIRAFASSYTPPKDPTQ